MSYNRKHQTVSKSQCVYRRSESDSSEMKTSSARSSSSSPSSPSSSSTLLRRLLLSIEGLDGSSGPTLKREVVESTLKLEEEKSGGECIVVDADALRRLESEKAVNWSNELRRHFPIKTLALSEDGQRINGLLESISLLLWGSDAAASLLSRLLFVMLVEVGQIQLRPRWTRHHNRSHRRTILDLEWTILVNSVQATNPSSDVNTVVPTPSHDLQNSLYVFALANITRRPIIVVDDQNHIPDSRKQSFSGLYLPLLSDADSCSSVPLLLVYHEGCFSPLVEREVDSRNRVGRPFFPVASGNMEPLVVRFLTETEEDDQSALLKRYLNVRELTLTTWDKKSVTGVLCATLYSDYMHESDVTDSTVRDSETKDVRDGRGFTSELQLKNSSTHALSTRSTPRNQALSLNSRQSTTYLSEAEGACPADNDSLSAEEEISRPCAATNCEYFGRWGTDWMCSSCHSQRIRESGDKDRLKRTTSDQSETHLGSKVISQFSSGATNIRLENASGFEKNYLDMINHQQRRIEQLASKCRTFSCYNFGNAQCRGSCHACHMIMTKR